MADLYRRALAIVVPSYEETFSLPVVEAIDAGIPVLCSDPEDSHWLPYREFGARLMYCNPSILIYRCVSAASFAPSMERQ